MIIPNIAALFSTGMGIHLQKLFLAFILIVIAFLIAKAIQIAVVYILELLSVEALSEKIGLTSLLKKADIKNSFNELAGELSFWTVLLICGVAIIYSLKFMRALEILRIMLLYITVNVVSAIFILVLAVILASLLSGLILFIGGLIYLPGYKLIARVNQYIVVIFGIVLGLEKLGISATVFARPDIILGFFALSGAIAFGLGCKDIAESFLANFLRNKQ